MSAWLLTTVALSLALVFPLALCLFGPAGSRLVASQTASSVGVLVLAAMTFAFSQASSIDLALTLALLGLPATLLFAVFLERWL